MWGKKLLVKLNLIFHTGCSFGFETAVFASNYHGDIANIDKKLAFEEPNFHRRPKEKKSFRSDSFQKNREGKSLKKKIKKMSVIDILTRVDAICKRYDKYDVEKQKDLNVSGDDAFARLYAVVDADIEAALQVTPISVLSIIWSVVDGFLIRLLFGFRENSEKGK